ncbi:hypothetical protein QL285_037210 [Trifolium repens]|nr:hypothetical protein QL285_037210 [Trifolium repens]
MPKSSNFAHSQQLCRREVSVDQNCRIIDDFIKEFLNSNRGGNIRKQAEAEELARKVESLNAESVSL